MIQEITNQFDQRLPVARPFYLPQDRLPQMELRVFGALCDVRAPEVIPSLEQFAESSDVYIRVRALQGLRKIGSLTSAPVFLRALNEPREEIGFIAMMSLIELAGGGSFDWVPRYDEILGAPDFYAAQFRQWWEAEGEARSDSQNAYAPLGSIRLWLTVVKSLSTQNASGGRDFESDFWLQQPRCKIS